MSWTVTHSSPTERKLGHLESVAGFDKLTWISECIVIAGVVISCPKLVQWSMVDLWVALLERLGFVLGLPCL